MQNSDRIKTKEGRVKRYFKLLYSKVVRGSGTPEYIARGWALGMFVGCFVPIFCQLIVAVPLSFVFRCSKIGAAGGTFITTPPTAVFIYPVQVWIGVRLIGGSLTLTEIKDATAALVKNGDYHSFISMSGEVIAAFFAGGFLWGLIMTPLTYYGVKYLVVRYRRMREERKKKREAAVE